MKMLGRQHMNRGKQQAGCERGCDPLGQGNEKGSVRPQYGSWRWRHHHEMPEFSLEKSQEEAIP